MYRLKNIFGTSILHLILLFILFFVLIVILNSSLSFNADLIKHWSTYFRDDIVFVYNSLLYNEGLDQHHLDHPSLFTFISCIYSGGVVLSNEELHVSLVSSYLYKYIV